MIYLENISKVYSSDTPMTALEEITLEVPRGSFVAVLGPSGSGKSTLLNVVGALTRPTSGRLVVDDIDITSASEKERATFRNEKIGFVFQSFHVLSDRTALENVMLPARFSRTVVPDVKKRAAECLEKVGLGDRIDSPCSSLSGGQLQRVAISRALLMKPPLLLADEPTGNLDTNTGAEILELFVQLHSDAGLTLMVVTHEEALTAAADIVLTIEDGKLMQGGNS